jgi:hypothetical protein
VLDLLKNPVVLVGVATYVLGFGTNAARHWLKKRAHRRVIVAELQLEAARTTPGMDDDQRAELTLRFAKADEEALEDLVNKADPSVLAGLIGQLVRR